MLRRKAIGEIIATTMLILITSIFGAILYSNALSSSTEQLIVSKENIWKLCTY